MKFTRAAVYLSFFFFVTLSLCSAAQEPAATPIDPVAVSKPISYSVEKTVTKNTEEMVLGDRVLGTNPVLSEEDRLLFGEEPTTETHQGYMLLLPHENNSATLVELLRPKDWLDDDFAKVVEAENELGEKESIVFVWLELPEMGTVGWAELIGVFDDIEIKQGKGNVVTGRFVHLSDNIIDLKIEGQEPIGCTANHPFWSVDRQDYVDAGQLNAGEQVILYNGETKRVVDKLPRPGPELVYNIEVFGEHVYHVGENGVLVHNSCTHGNSASTQRPATLYARFTKEGVFQKWGISQHPDTRYTKKELKGDFIEKYISGTRREMLDIERDLVETLPGPLNHERWAGKRSTPID